MRPQELKLGSVSPPVRRGSLVAVLFVALVLRADAVVQLVRGTGPGEGFPGVAEVFRSPAVAWTHAPLVRILQGLDASAGLGGRGWLAVQLVASLLVVLWLLRRVPRWLGFGAGLGAALLWSVSDVAVGAVFATSGALLFAWFSLDYADFLLRLVQRRASVEAWRLGVRVGVLTWLSGLGLGWLVATLAWLPFMSHRFRGWSGLRAAGWVLLAWLLVLSPIPIRNAWVQGDPAPPFATAAVRTYEGARGWSVAARASTLSAGSSYAQRATQWGQAFSALGEDGAAGWSRAARRAVAFLGGWAPRVASPGLALPWSLLPVIAWLGWVALLPSLRAFVPLYLGVALPVLCAAFAGVDAGWACVASPFVATFAGYGIARVWEGRRWTATWLVAPVLLALSILLHLMVRGWA